MFNTMKTGANAFRGVRKEEMLKAQNRYIQTMTVSFVDFRRFSVTVQPLEI